MEKRTVSQKPFLELRKRMMEYDCKNQDIGEAIGMSPSAVSNRLNAQKSFSIDDAYTICELLNIPTEDLPKYFPDTRTQARKAFLVVQEVDGVMRRCRKVVGEKEA